jgi:hypothetical protein
MTIRWSADLFRRRTRWSAAIPVPQIPGGGGGGGGPIDPSNPGTDPVDPTPPSVGFSSPGLRVPESAGIVSIPLSLNFGYQYGVVARVQHYFDEELADIPFDRDDDWTWRGTATDPSVSEAYFAPGQLTSSILVSISNDTAEEGLELVSYRIVEVLTQIEDSGEVVSGGIFGFNRFDLYVEANDEPGVPVVTLNAQSILIPEGTTSSALRVQVSEAAPVAITGNLTVTNITASSGDYTVPATYTIPANQTSAPIEISATLDSEIEVLELFSVALGTPSYGTLGTLTSATVGISDQTSQPIVEWEILTSQFVENAVAGEIEIRLIISNSAEVQGHQGCTVNVNFSGSATPGVDYFINSATMIGFAPGQFTRSIRLQINPDTDVEPDETIVMQIVDPDGCSIGQRNIHTTTIINDDQATGGASLRPSLYYPSEFFKIGGETRTMVVDLGSEFESPVTIGYECWEGPNTVSGDHGLGATGNFSSVAGSRYAFMNITVPSGSTSGNQKRFVVQLTSTTHGQLGLNTRFVGIIQGGADHKDLIPPRPTVPGTDDIRVWRNRYRLSPFSVDVAIPSGVESIGWALRHNGNYQTLWAAKNATYPKWFQEGTPVVVRVMEDLKDNTTLPIGFGVGASGHGVNSPDWIALGNVGPSGVIAGARDLIIVGDGGTPKQVRGVGFATNDGYNGDQNTNVNWPTMAIDNVQFWNLEFIPAFGTNAVITSAFDNVEQKDHNGLLHFYDCVWNEADALLGGPIGPGNFKQGMRINTRASFRIEGCTMKGHEHSAYLDRLTGLCLFYDNNNPGFADSGNGRTMIQVATRPNEFGGGGPGHGLIAIVDNVSHNNGWRRDTGAKDITVYGHNGEVWIDGNEHTGHLQEPGQNTNNRGLVGILMSGNSDGVYAFLFPLLSGYWAGFKHVVFRNDIVNLISTDTWNGNPYFFNGCANLVIGDWTVTSVPNLLGRDVFQFNTAAVVSGSGFMAGPDGGNIRESAWTSPSGFSWTFPRFPNRPDGITYEGGPLSMGFGAYLTQSTKRMGSFRYGVHLTLASNVTASQVFSSFPTTSIDAYNGRDLVS